MPEPAAATASGFSRPLEEAMRTPKGRYGSTTRSPVGEVVHVDRYGNQPFGTR